MWADNNGRSLILTCISDFRARNCIFFKTYTYIFVIHKKGEGKYFKSYKYT